MYIPVHLTFFILVSSSIYLGYNKLDKLLTRYNNKYNEYDDDKKKYIVKNLFKSIHLGIMSFLAFYLLINFFFYDNWDFSSLSQVCGMVYGLPDTIAIFVVPNLAISTYIHHTCVTALWLVNFFMEIHQFHFWRGIVILTLFSVLSGSVNFYLAFRFLCPESKWKNPIKKFAYYNYICVLIGSWSYHLYIFYTQLFILQIFDSIGFWLYFIVSFLILYDDLVLLHFLSRIKQEKLLENVKQD